MRSDECSGPPTCVVTSEGPDWLTHTYFCFVLDWTACRGHPDISLMTVHQGATAVECGVFCLDCVCVCARVYVCVCVCVSLCVCCLRICVCVCVCLLVSETQGKE